jgi:hypothetical protein
MVGAGASAGSAPLGREFWIESPRSYLRDLLSFPATVTPRSPLTQRMIDYCGIEIEDIFPGICFRPGTDEFPIRAFLKRLPNGFAREQLKHVLARARYLARTEGTVTNSYRVFRTFHPSVIADYNHDGLSQEFCGANHAIVGMHGTIHPVYGSPEFAEWISDLREYDIALPHDGLIMGLSESWADDHLRRRLSWVMSRAVEHVTIIGYSFAQIGKGYDDAVTLAYFVHRFRGFRGPIFVISPDPSRLCEMLSDALKIKTVYPVKRYWNVLAHGYLESLRNPDKFRSLDHAHGSLYDRHGSGKAFPIPVRRV